MADDRVERDSMGEMQVPGEALYGAETARAVQNFPISGQPIGRELVRALGLVKQAAAEVHRDLGLLEPRLAEAIAAAAAEVAAGRHDAHFPVDVFQTGSGTSSHMNANEVIANLANLRLGARLGAKAPVHPHDHVNLGQSSNDVFPSAIHLAAVDGLEGRLLPALAVLEQRLGEKAARWREVIKIGRTHLQDATPLSVGQQFSGYAAQVRQARLQLESCLPALRELALGGTAVGTGLNTHPEFGRRVAARLSALTGRTFVEASNHFAAQAAPGAAVAASGALRATALALTKVANDLRFLGSGPRLGYGELVLPAVQPGSSMMPGKVNPVLAEALLMVAGQVVGNDAAVAFAASQGNFELHTMLPLVARSLLESIRLLAAGVRVFDAGLVRGLALDEERLRAQAGRALTLVTALVPRLGYDRAAWVAGEALRTGRTLREVALTHGLLPAEELDELLDPGRMLAPGGGPPRGGS
ncbi:MAG TPA: class II fumarate hydratase [Myxococcota bacterium]|nr:class II fumarate hydratase [Myxococcota bacterium]HRY96172.1 class II fumarate hydratase [Myxococcota bacterium]HSA22521.1 class II fumarate hydratase [Myxococcota bacterium]